MIKIIIIDDLNCLSKTNQILMTIKYFKQLNVDLIKQYNNNQPLNIKKQLQLYLNSNWITFETF